MLKTESVVFVGGFGFQIDRERLRVTGVGFICVEYGEFVHGNKMAENESEIRRQLAVRGWKTSHRETPIGPESENQMGITDWGP